MSAEALHSGEYSSISSANKQTLHLNKLKSIYRSGNNHSLSSQSRLSNNVTGPFTGQQVVNNVIYSTNAGPTKAAYSTKVQPKSIYKAVKRKLKSGEKKVNLAEIALANNYLSGDLNLKFDYGENSANNAFRSG